MLLLTPVLLGAMVDFPSCVAEGNCPRVAGREEPHVALLGVIAGSSRDRVISGSARDHRFRALVATSTSARGPRGRFKAAALRATARSPLNPGRLVTVAADWAPPEAA